MNFVFISPNFPKTYWNFCDRLQHLGVTVLGIGDAAYDTLDNNLKSSLKEYYKVSSLEDYSEVFRAVAYFSFHYGKIDWLESNNEYWLELDAKLRTDFHITTGMQDDFISRIKYKSKMKESYQKAHIPCARYHMVSTIDKAKEFIATVQYPVVVKPDNGCGAESTYKLKNDHDLEEFFTSKPEVSYIMEEFIQGTIESFDGVCDSSCEPIFYTSNVFPVPIMNIVNTKDHLAYWTVKEVPEKLCRAGTDALKSFGAKSRFFHLEFFKLTEDKAGLGKAGDYVALEVNMRPAGGYTPDMINYANSVDVYSIWADMVVYDRNRQDMSKEKYFCVYASRRDEKRYVHTHQEILNKYGNSIVMCERMPEALAKDMGNQMYTAKLKEEESRKEFISFVQQEEG